MKCMKSILICIALALSVSLSGQQHGDHLNLGLGLNGIGLPIGVSYDWGFQGDFNLGLGASLALSSRDYGGSPIGLGFFTQWYADDLLDLPSEFDAYASGGVYYYTYKGGDAIDLNISIGGRYYFDDRLGLNIELGGGSVLSGGRVGVTWRM